MFAFIKISNIFIKANIFSCLVYKFYNTFARRYTSTKCENAQYFFHIIYYYYYIFVVEESQIYILEMISEMRLEVPKNYCKQMYIKLIECCKPFQGTFLYCQLNI